MTVGPGDIVELEEDTPDAVMLNERLVRLSPEKFVVGLVDEIKGVVHGHVSGVLLTVAFGRLKDYSVIRTVEGYPFDKIRSELHRVRVEWLDSLGGVVARGSEVRWYISKLNEVLATLVHERLGFYYFKFMGIYRDHKKVDPVIVMKWLPPTNTSLGTTVRSQENGEPNGRSNEECRSNQRSQDDEDEGDQAVRNTEADEPGEQRAHEASNGSGHKSSSGCNSGVGRKGSEDKARDG